MITDDLFAELGRTAAEYGWRGIGQPERLNRRYGQRIGDAEVTVTVVATTDGRALHAIYWREATERGSQITRSAGPRSPRKRDTALAWLREGRDALDT